MRSCLFPKVSSLAPRSLRGPPGREWRVVTNPTISLRSEERRVGKECRSRRSRYTLKTRVQDHGCRDAPERDWSIAYSNIVILLCFFFQAEDGIRDHCVTGVQTCALPISGRAR